MDFGESDENGCLTTYLKRPPEKKNELNRRLVLLNSQLISSTHARNTFNHRMFALVDICSVPVMAIMIFMVARVARSSRSPILPMVAMVQTVSVLYHSLMNIFRFRLFRLTRRLVSFVVSNLPQNGRVCFGVVILAIM